MDDARTRSGGNARPRRTSDFSLTTIELRAVTSFAAAAAGGVLSIFEAQLPDDQLPDDQLPDYQLPDDQLPDDQLPDDGRPRQASTAHLDADNESLLRASVLAASGGKTLVWTTHRHVDLGDFDEVVTLDRGRVIVDRASRRPPTALVFTNHK